MNTLQKQILCAGLAVMAASTVRAPYRWTAVDTIASLTVRPGFQRHGTTYAPVWVSQSKLIDDVRTAGVLDREEGDHWVLEQIDVNLNVGLLGLWWAGIAAVATVAVLLARTEEEKPKPAQPPKPVKRGPRSFR